MTDYTLESTIYIMFSTRAFATGAPTQLAGTPAVSAYENESLTQITAGITLGVDHDTVTGLNLLTVVATAANGYESGKDYHLVITTGTVGGVSVVGEVVGRFTLGRSAAAVDLANGTDGLGAIKTDTAAILVDTGTTLQAEVDAIQAAVITNAAGVDIAADIIALKAETAAILLDTGTTLDNLVDDLESRLGTPSDLGSGASIAANLVDIEAQTDDIGVAGAGLTNINLPNQTMDIVGNITGSLSGSVGSVTGAVGSVTGNVGGNVTGSVGSLATQARTDVRTAIGMASNDLDTQLGGLETSLTTIAGYLDTEIAAILEDTGTTIPDQIDALNNIAVADILGATVTEGFSTAGGDATLAQMLHEIRQGALEFSISGTTLTAKKKDGSTTAMTFTLDDATDPTSRTRAT